MINTSVTINTPRGWGLLGQAVKTAAAAVMSLYVCKAVGLPEDYWAAVSAIIVMQSDLKTTLHDGLSRLAGTAIGAIVGGCAVMVLGASVPSFALAVIVTILICAVLDKWESYRFASVTVAIAMLVSHHGSPWTAVLHRFLAVSVGIIMAAAVILAWPRDRKEAIKIPKKLS